MEGRQRRERGERVMVLVKDIVIVLILAVVVPVIGGLIGFLAQAWIGSGL